MRNIITVTLLTLISITTFGQELINKEIKKRVTTELEKESIHSVFLGIHSKSKGIDINLVDSKDSLNTNSPFYTASITKMLTATSIGILKDRKKINFEDKIAKYLPKTLIDRLHVLEGEEYSKDITIAHLLQHTSGLPDYFTDTTVDGSPNIINQLLIDTNKSWSAKEVITFAKQKMKPHFAPGKGYHYTDTEYVLLALIVEKVSNLSLDEFFKQHIFIPLGMKSSYINLKSLPIDNKLSMAKFYVNDMELSSINSLSADWGGGGLVSTTKDLITFLEAYMSDKIVRKNTRLEMQNWVDETKGMEYGFGIRKVTFKNLTLFGHTGTTASFLWYCPQLDTYVAGTFNQLTASKSTLNFVLDLLKIIENN